MSGYYMGQLGSPCSPKDVQRILELLKPNDKFGPKSQACLAQAHPLFTLVFNQVVEIKNCTLIQSVRGESGQKKAILDGTTTLPWPDSLHNKIPAMAVDVQPWPFRETDHTDIHRLAGVILAVSKSMGIPLTWGGDWDGDGDTKDQKLVDLFHWELNFKLLPLWLQTYGTVLPIA